MSLRPWMLSAVGVVLMTGAVARADSAADLWTSKCKSCHAEDGTGKTKIGQKEKVADLSNSGWQSKHSDGQIRTVIADGSSDNKKMKPFKDKLSPAEIDSLVAYIRSFKK